MKFIPSDGTEFFIQETFDMSPNIESVKELKSNDALGTNDAWHVARIDKRMMGKLINEAGLRWDDTEAVRDLIDGLLHDGTLSKLRVHEGSYR